MKPRMKVEIYYFGCCAWSYFFAYGGGFLDEEWTRVGGDFRKKLEEHRVEILEINLLENPELVEKYASQIDPYNPFSSHQRFFLDDEEVSKKEFFEALPAPEEARQEGLKS